MSKTKSDIYHIAEWSLDVLMVKPDEAAIEDIAKYINGNRDLVRITNVSDLAAFVLCAVDPKSKARVFNYSDIQLLDRRSFLVIDAGLQYIGGSVSDEIGKLLSREVKNGKAATGKKRSKGKATKSRHP
jgi:hypothetical protein